MNVEGHLGASFLASFGNAGGRRWDTDMLLIRLDRWIDKYIDGERRGEGGREGQGPGNEREKGKVVWLLIQLGCACYESP